MKMTKMELLKVAYELTEKAVREGKDISSLDYSKNTVKAIKERIEKLNNILGQNDRGENPLVHKKNFKKGGNIFLPSTYQLRLRKKFFKNGYHLPNQCI